MNKILICYFSASGITKKVAEHIATITRGDLFEIEPMELYTTEDLNWNNNHSRSSIEMMSDTIRPKIKNKVNKVEDYPVILLGYPIWWDLAPRIVNSFIEEYNLEGKKVYIFATSGGSGVENSFSDLKRRYPNINFISAKRLSPSISNDEILTWISSTI